MKIISQKVKLSNADVKKIYFDSFPKNERMPFPMMVAMSKLRNTEFLGFYDGDTLCGFAYFAHNSKIVFIMFLAVDKTLRSKGYGALYYRTYKTDILTKRLSFPLNLAIKMHLT